MNYNQPINYYKKTVYKNAKFSILIPTWNNLEILKLCIASIQQNSKYEHQIIIHVNEGSDGTLQWIKDNNFDYTYSLENVGVCYAMNAMATLVTTDYVLYINDDMYACPDWDKYLFDAIENHGNNYFYFSATMIEPFGKNNLCAIAPFNFGISKDTFAEEKLLDFVKTIEKKDWFGASWPPSIVHKTIWDMVDGYSVEYSPGFGSDPDFSRKLWHIGVREFRGVGRSLVYHFQSKSTGRVVKNNGRLTFATKWGIPSSYFYKNVLRLGQNYDSKKLTMTYNHQYFYARCRAFFIVFKNKITS